MLDRMTEWTDQLAEWWVGQPERKTNAALVVLALVIVLALVLAAR